jgi:hypothetical protein
MLWFFMLLTVCLIHHTLVYLPGTSREIDLAAETIIICCDATFLLKPNRRQCFRCIYRQDALIQSMVNAVTSSASDGSFYPPYFGISARDITRNRSRSRDDHHLL